MEIEQKRFEYLDIMVRSEFRNDYYNTTPAKFSISLPKIPKVNKAMLLSASIPNCIDNLSSSNNTLKIVETKDSKEISVSITAGYYSASTLSTALKTALDAKSTSVGNGYTYTITEAKAPTYKMTIASTGAFSITYDDTTSPLAFYLGFRATSADATATASATSHTANFKIDIRGCSTLYINTNLCAHTIDEWKNKTYLLGSVQIDSGYMSINNYVNDNGDMFKCGDQDLDCLNITLTDQYDSVVDLQADWQMIVRVSVPWGTTKNLTC